MSQYAIKGFEHNIAFTYANINGNIQLSNTVYTLISTFT